MTEMPQLSVLAITGSLRAASYNTALLRAVAGRSPAALAIAIVDLAGIPLFNADEETRHGAPAAVSALAERIRAADGVIIASPEYNFSIPGVLKNATDWLSRGRNQPFKDKRVGVMGASSGSVGTARAQYHLRQNLQALEALVMPKPEIFLGNAAQKFGDDGRLTDEATLGVVDLWLTRFEAWLRRQ